MIVEQRSDPSENSNWAKSNKSISMLRGVTDVHWKVVPVDLAVFSSRRFDFDGTMTLLEPPLTEEVVYAVLCPVIVDMGRLKRNLRDLRIDEVNEADMAVKREVKVDEEDGVIEGVAIDSRSRCDVSSEQFSDVELSPNICSFNRCSLFPKRHSPVEPVEPYNLLFSLLLLLIADEELERNSSQSCRDMASLRR